MTNLQNIMDYWMISTGYGNTSNEVRAVIVELEYHNSLSPSVIGRVSGSYIAYTRRSRLADYAIPSLASIIIGH